MTEMSNHPLLTYNYLLTYWGGGEEADGNGYGAIAGRRGPIEAAAQSER